MNFKLLFFLLLLGTGLSCAPRQTLVQQTIPNKPSDIATPIPVPPAPILTDEHLLGFMAPAGMIEDPESGHRALPGVMQAFWRFKKQAKTDGWNLILVSAYRSYRDQRRVWNQSDDSYLQRGATNQKKRVEAVMSLVSVPGLSRHHWGTELDISEASIRGKLVNVEPDTPERVLKFYAWMQKNAPQYGFCQVYLGQNGSVHNEPWHWSFLPYSKTYQKQFMAIKNFKRIFDVNVEDVDYLMKNFNRILKDEKNSINPTCGD
ncbi:MAG TPA: D-alanyl-D-alanine carboxypeptidase family protein [bacterium]|nr:D-alanyl-D-alanine carboxypeptidase family protein [bacterium]